MEHKEGKKQLIRTAGRKIIQKSEDRLRSLWDISKCANIQIIGLSEGEEEEQEIENLPEKIMKEKFPNLAKQADIQVQEAQSPK